MIVQNAFKIEDEPRFSDTDLTNDAELFIKNIPIGLYWLMAWIISEEEANNPNLKFLFENQDSLVGNINYFVNHFGSFPKQIRLTDFATDTGEIEMSAAIEGNSVINGTLEVTTAGTLAFKWAQFNSDADDTIIKAGSYLRLMPF